MWRQLSVDSERSELGYSGKSERGGRLNEIFIVSSLALSTGEAGF